MTAPALRKFMTLMQLIGMTNVFLISCTTTWLTQGFAMFRSVQPTVGLDPAAESRLRLKIDLYIVPVASLMYLFCFIDRANIGKVTLY